jgi:hypothetical protein
MKTDFRNRVFLPIVLPLLILLGMAAFIGVFALTLLYSTHEASLMLAALAAGGILFVISLAASQDRLDPLRRGVLAVAVLVPFLIGGAFAAGLVGDVPDEARMINVEPPAEAPEDAILAAENQEEFCLPSNGECEPTEFWSVAAQDAEQFVYAFENRDDTAPHNLSIRELAGDRDAPEPGEVIHEGELLTSVGESTETVEPGLEPGDYYFVCDVHASTMFGVLEINGGGDGDGGEEADDAGDEDAGDEDADA